MYNDNIYIYKVHRVMIYETSAIGLIGCLVNQSNTLGSIGSSIDPKSLYDYSILPRSMKLEHQDD
jgi:hypothetical protein